MAENYTPKLGDKVCLHGRITAIPKDEADPYLFRYADKPGACVWVPADAPFCHDCDSSDELKKAVEQLIVQLAGCGVAALGGTSPEQIAERGSYGWSVAYQNVLDLRRNYDKTMERLAKIDSSHFRPDPSSYCTGYEHNHFIKGDRVRTKNNWMKGTFRKYNKDGRCVVKMDCLDGTLYVDAFVSKKGYSLFDEDELVLLSRKVILPDPKPVHYKKSKTFKGLHDYVTTGNRRFNKGDHVKCFVGDDSMNVTGTFIKYYKGKVFTGTDNRPRCLFRPDNPYDHPKGSSKKGYYIVPESSLFLITDLDA